MLVLGAQSGWFVATLCNRFTSVPVADPRALAMVSAAAFITAVVRAPLTGILLVIEMTNCFSFLLPMLGACFTAMLVPTWFANEPIYESLKRRTLAASAQPNRSAGNPGGAGRQPG